MLPLEPLVVGEMRHRAPVFLRILYGKTGALYEREQFGAVGFSRLYFCYGPFPKTTRLGPAAGSGASSRLLLLLAERVDLSFWDGDESPGQILEPFKRSLFVGRLRAVVGFVSHGQIVLAALRGLVQARAVSVPSLSRAR